MRQRKLLKRFVATPMRRSDFLLALASSRLVLMIVEVGLLLVFGVLVFIYEWKVHCFRFLLVGALGGCRLVGSDADRQPGQKIESVSGLINLVMMPMWISPACSSPTSASQNSSSGIRALPLTALNDALRAIILQGAPLIRSSAESRCLPCGAECHRSSLALVPLELNSS